MLDFLRDEGVSPQIIAEVEAFRAKYPVGERLAARVPVSRYLYYGKDVWEEALTALDTCLTLLPGAADAMLLKLQACAAMGDFCVAIYNPSSKARPDYLQRAVRILLQNGKSEETVCGIVRNIGRERQQSAIITLRELENKQVDMFTTVYIGNKTTKNIESKMVTPRGYRTV